MANVKLGEKHECHDCGAKFYDFGKDPVICPKCGTDQRTGEPEPEPEEILVEGDGADGSTEPDEVAVVGDDDVDDDDVDDDLDDLPDLDDEDFGDDDEDDGDDDFEDD